jgi:hypothetical protein
VELIERSSETVRPVPTHGAKQECLGCAAAAIGGGRGGISEGAGFQELKNDQAVMNMETLCYGSKTAQGKSFGTAGVVEIGAEAVRELSGEGLVFGEFAADGKGISNHNAERVALCQCGRIMEAVRVGGEIHGVIVAKGGKISDPGDSAVRIIAVIVLVRDERADRIRVAA